MSFQHIPLSQLQILASLGFGFIGKPGFLLRQLNGLGKNMYTVLEVGQLGREGLKPSEPLNFRLQGSNSDLEL